MAFDEDKLKKALADNYKNIADNGLSMKDSADGITEAIVNYAKDAEVIVNAPPMIPTSSGPVPDGSVVGQKAKVTTATTYKSALGIAILGSLTEMINGDDDKMALITATIVLYAATFLNFKTSSGAPVVGTTVMSTPPVLVPALKKGMDGGTIDDVAEEMAKIINTSFKAAMFTGVVTNPSTGAVIPGAVVGTLQ